MPLEGLVNQSYLQMFSVILYETMCCCFHFFICFSDTRKIEMQSKLTHALFHPKWQDLNVRCRKLSGLLSLDDFTSNLQFSSDLNAHLIKLICPSFRLLRAIMTA